MFIGGVKLQTSLEDFYKIARNRLDIDFNALLGHGAFANVYRGKPHSA